MNSVGDVVHETVIEVAVEPSILGFSPSVLVNRTADPNQQQRIRMEVSDIEVFRSYNWQALVYGQVFEVIADKDSVYFDFNLAQIVQTDDDIAGAVGIEKEEYVQIRLLLDGLVVSPEVRGKQLVSYKT